MSDHSFNREIAKPSWHRSAVGYQLGYLLISNSLSEVSIAVMKCFSHNVVWLSLLVFAGCATSRSTSTVAPSMNQISSVATYQNEGYSLLYDLVSKEANVSKLLIIKKESPQLKAVIQKVARESGQIGKELAELARQSPPLNLKVISLPMMEQKTRELIEKETGKGLLKAKGEPFEFKLLQSQIEGMNYGSHLAEALLEMETNPARRAFLLRTQRNLAELRDEIYQMILNRYIRSR